MSNTHSSNHCPRCGGVMLNESGTWTTEGGEVFIVHDYCSDLHDKMEAFNKDSLDVEDTWLRLTADFYAHERL